MSHATPTPAIRIYESSSHHSRRSAPRRPAALLSSTGSSPMAVPNARESPPSPKPPPRHIPELSEGYDSAWLWANKLNAQDTERSPPVSIKPGSSLLGGRQLKRERSAERLPRDVPEIARRHSTIPALKHAFEGDSMSLSKEDRDALRRPSLANHRLQSERQLEQKSLEDSSQAYDKQLLSKIGGPNAPGRPTNPFLTTAASHDGSAVSSPRSFGRQVGQLKPLSLPDRRISPMDSPGARWAGDSASATASPRSSVFRSPIFEQSPSASTQPSRLGSVSTPGAIEDSRAAADNSDQGIFMDNELVMDEVGTKDMKDLVISERSPSGPDSYRLAHKASLKRRASSPPTDALLEERIGSGNPSDLYHRRSQQKLATQDSPGSRYQGGQGSVSSASSFGTQRNESYASSYSLSVASSATSHTGTERISPSGLASLADSDPSPMSPFSTGRSLKPSPRGSISRGSHQQQAAMPEVESAQSRKTSTDSSVSKIQGMYICECCPKKPKKFDSEEELRLHESEKQYTCQYCPNRFKNKNEAERHQNSLHLRRQSWSCAALSGVRAAFHPCSLQNPSADFCGYCGDEFPNPANWDVRSEHLNHVHKFGECNQAKKFYRADHFRQHLKHSHAGTSGKWTNMLETACMKDEPPLKERGNSVGSLTASAAAAVANLGPVPLRPGVIDEVHNES